MAAIVVREASIEELASASNLGALCDEYSRESAISELGGGHINVEMYRGMESAGFLRTVIVLREGVIVGFALVIFADLPHFSKRIATAESFFVASAARAGGAGTLLREAVERLARAGGAVGVLISAPIDGRLDRILPRSGYRMTNHVFYRSLV